MTARLLEIELDKLMPDPGQPRKTFLKEEIERLAASISARGVLCPLRVLWDEERKAWRIIVGESRWRAARLAGLKTVPCLPVDGEPSETDILADQLIENTARNHLRPLELARALAKLKALKKCTSQQLAAELGISGASICRAESLLSLPDAIQGMVDQGSVSESAAYEISRIDEPGAQMELAQAVASGTLSRDGVAAAVRGRIGQRSVRPRAARLPLRLEGGISITVTAAQPLTWDDFNTAIDRVRREAKKFYDGGKDISELARALRPL
jgi:ParB family transcriptional regulator, chromosome partitioning protein